MLSNARANRKALEKMGESDDGCLSRRGSPMRGQAVGESGEIAELRRQIEEAHARGVEEGRRAEHEEQKAKGARTRVGRIRNAIAVFSENNAEKIQAWMDRIEEEGSGRDALKSYLEVLEFAMPKLQRVEADVQVSTGDMHLQAMRQLRELSEGDVLEHEDD